MDGIMEFPRDDAGRVSGYQVGKAFRMLEHTAAKEAREYEHLFRALELRNARAVSDAEVRRVKRRHLRSPLDRPLFALPSAPCHRVKAKRARAAADHERYRKAHPLTDRECRHCGCVYMPRHQLRLHCSERCKVRAAVIRRARAVTA